MSDNKIPITVVIPCKNEEVNLPKCLGRLKRFQEVIVVDSSSTDRTADIASDQEAKVIQFVWNGGYPKKRNWLLLNYRFVTEWVLFIDADEFITELFCDEVNEAIKKAEFDGYWLKYTNYFLGRRLNFGVPQRKLALFQLGSGLYERIDERSWSPLDMEVHEHPIIDGKIGEIITPIDHNDDRGISKFLERHRDYALWEANRILLLERNSGTTKLTRRQRFKYGYIQKWWYAWAYFFYTYVVKLGCLDGSAGFYYAFYKTWYFLSIRLIILDLQKAPGLTADNIACNNKS